MPSPEIIVKPQATLAQVFVERLVAWEREAQARAARFAIVLPGGSVAEVFAPRLAVAPLDWNGCDVFWGDERAVPPDHPDSNFRLANDLLLTHVPIPPARIHRMEADAADLDAAAAAYEQTIVSVLGTPPRFDVVVIGVGPDGHVCSLFPGHPALRETRRLVVAVTDSPKPPPTRLTLTLPAIADANVVIAAFGTSKAAAMQDALTDPASELPVAQAIRGARHALVLLDPDAAGPAIAG